MVCSTMISVVKESQVFALMVDETKKTKKEQLSIVLRYYYREAIKESFFEVAEHLNVAGLAGQNTICL